MFTPFESLPDHARLWIYQADRKLSPSEIDIISGQLASFTEQWQVHGKPMQSSFKIYFDLFVMLAADEGYNAASGCSIDGSVRLLKNLGAQLNINFLSREAVAFKISDKVMLINVKELKQKNFEDVWNKETLMFNNLISSKGEIEKNWLIPAETSWLKRYLLPEEIKVK